MGSIVRFLSREVLISGLIFAATPLITQGALASQLGDLASQPQQMVQAATTHSINGFLQTLRRSGLTMQASLPIANHDPIFLPS